MLESRELIKTTWKSGDAQQTEINWNAIFGKVYRICKDESLAWQALAVAWERYNERPEMFAEPIGVRARWLRTTAIQEVYDHWKREKRYIAESNMRQTGTEGSAYISETGDDVSHESPIQNILGAELEPCGENELILELVQGAPPELRQPFVIIMKAIFNNIFTVQLSEESIRQRLNAINYTSTLTRRELSRRLYKYILDRASIVAQTLRYI